MSNVVSRITLFVRFLTINLICDVAFGLSIKRSVWSTSHVTVLENKFPIQPESRRKRLLPFRKRYMDDTGSSNVGSFNVKFDYDCDVLHISSEREIAAGGKKHRCVLLIQPIGVGIGRWYYERLLNEFESRGASFQESFSIIVPDLLGSGTASRPYISKQDEDDFQIINTTMPLLTVQDWSNQLCSLMKSFEEELQYNEVEWMVVANGGCVPISLELGKRSVTQSSRQILNISKLCLTAPPRLSALLSSLSSFEKRTKSYKTLCGVAGSFFWWYSLRNSGKFIQNFSEKNLMAKKGNMGENWCPQCVHTAKSYEGYSKYSTFSFLAGSLQGGCQDTFDVLGQSALPISVIRGSDTRKNPARSWFWKKKSGSDDEEETLSSFLQKNGNDGKEIFVGGRRCKYLTTVILSFPTLIMF